MGQPTRSSLALNDPVVSNFALDYGDQNLVTLSGSGFGNTADFMFPRMPHTAAGLTGRFYTYNFANKLALGDDSRKEGNYPKITYDVSSDTYTLEDYGFSHEFDDRTQEAALGGVVNISEDAGEILAQRVLRKYANQAIALATTSGNYTAGITNTSAASAGEGVWDTSSTDIVQQVNLLKEVVFRNCGVIPDRIAFNMNVWTKGVMKNDAILAGLQATQRPAGLSDFENVKSICATFFGLEGAVDNTLYDSANVTGTFTPTYLFPNSVLVFVSQKRLQRVKAMRLGFTAVKSGEFLRGYRWDEAPHTNWRALSFQRSVKMVADEAGYLLTSVVT